MVLIGIPLNQIIGKLTNWRVWKSNHYTTTFESSYRSASTFHIEVIFFKSFFYSHAINAYLVSTYGEDDKLYPKNPKMRSVVDHRLHFDTGVLFQSYRNVIVSHKYCMEFIRETVCGRTNIHFSETFSSRAARISIENSDWFDARNSKKFWRHLRNDWEFLEESQIHCRRWSYNSRYFCIYFFNHDAGRYSSRSNIKEKGKSYSIYLYYGAV